MIIDRTAEARGNLIAVLKGAGDSHVSSKKIDEAVEALEESIGVGTKKAVIYIVVLLFVVSVGFLWLIFINMYSDELRLLEKGTIKPQDRIIDSKVLMTIIAGTVTQVSISFGSIMYFLFKVQDKKIEVPKISDESKVP
jgi:hypothetical protein